MSSSAERAAQLRAEADALDAMAGLEESLSTAKAAHYAAPDDDTKATKVAAALALREARRLTRSEGVSVGGDAYVVEEV